MFYFETPFRKTYYSCTYPCKPITNLLTYEWTTTRPLASPIWQKIDSNRVHVISISNATIMFQVGCLNTNVKWTAPSPKSAVNGRIFGYDKWRHKVFELLDTFSCLLTFEGSENGPKQVPFWGVKLNPVADEGETEKT